MNCYLLHRDRDTNTTLFFLPFSRPVLFHLLDEPLTDDSARIVVKPHRGYVNIYIPGFVFMFDSESRFCMTHIERPRIWYFLRSCAATSSGGRVIIKLFMGAGEKRNVQQQDI